ncbi:nucleotide exchange factor GrpE [Candidatus Cytomitobacter indipagum]|uniref:Protein GrpE n=1 Tax=Candidatus Cytomitobacter indipagum TaxID=2601575 RepID=A0A5C0UDR6_9PROT|nr:nucleotide exchange factor GrpE [Candidatus Cytomitobacter indipagum]QEK38138.1 nucleotide exchange factor GrpE [Candidatus Cytomitobacter indipagum]
MSVREIDFEKENFDSSDENLVNYAKELSGAVKEHESLIEKKESRIEELESSEKKLRNDWASALAEQKRLSEKMPEYIESRAKHVVNNFMLSVLEIVDNLELALRAAESDKNIHMGIQMIYKQTLSLLESKGVTQQLINVGDDFDPQKHEIIEENNSEYEKNKIIEVKSNGYMIKDEVLRHSRVSVSSGING